MIVPIDSTTNSAGSGTAVDSAIARSKVLIERSFYFVAEIVEFQKGK